MRGTAVLRFAPVSIVIYKTRHCGMWSTNDTRFC